MRETSAGAISASFASRRVRREDLCSSRCRALARSRITLPEPVILKRLLAPLCVLTFGMVRVSPRSDSYGGRNSCGSGLGGGLGGRCLVSLVFVVLVLVFLVLVV